MNKEMTKHELLQTLGGGIVPAPIRWIPRIAWSGYKNRGTIGKNYRRGWNSLPSRW